jgi:transposase
MVASVPSWQQQAETLLCMGVSVRKVAQQLNQSYSVVYRWWKAKQAEGARNEK